MVIVVAVIKTTIFYNGEAQGGLGGLDLDECDVANSFLMLPMARTGFKWPFMNPFFLYFLLLLLLLLLLLNIGFKVVFSDIFGLITGHLRPFRAIGSIGNEFAASISSSLSPPRPPGAL